MTTKSFVQRPFARAVFALDSRLRVRNGVFDYCDSPHCILRAQIDRAGRRIVLSDGLRLDPDDKLIELHYLTENFPPTDADGPTFAWARRALARMDFSLHALCRRLQSSSAFEDVLAVRAAPLLRSKGQTVQFERIAAHFGFAPAREIDPSPGRLHSLGENIVSLMLIAARNPVAAHADLLIGLRPPVFISLKRLQDRYRQTGPRRSLQD